MDGLILDIKHHSKKHDDKFKFVEDFLYFEKYMYIPKRPTQLCILQPRHDFSAIRHFEFNKTLEHVS